jgi:hypothetical protein
MRCIKCNNKIEDEGITVKGFNFCSTRCVKYTFEITCPDCKGKGYGEFLYLDCNRCSGNGKLPLNNL